MSFGNAKPEITPVEPDPGNAGGGNYENHANSFII